MPSADDRIPDFDDFLDPQPQAEPPKTAPKKTKPGKKKGKKQHAAPPPPPVADDEDTAWPKSVTPSPPTRNGVSLGTSPEAGVTAPPPPEPEPEPEPIAEPIAEPEPEARLADEPIDETPFAWDEDTTVPAAAAEPEPAPAPGAKISPAPSPVARSPRPAIAKPVLPATSPPVRPPTQFSPPQHNYRGSNGFAPAPLPPRRPSFAAQQRPSKSNVFDPPPPHMPQAHFFGVPDLGLSAGPKQEQGSLAGSNGYCCRFDTFADAGDAVSARKGKDALLVGSERCLEVYKVSPDKMEIAGRLEGLRGAVIDAKVLPHVSVYDPAQSIRPLVAVIVHGREEADTAESVDVKAESNMFQTSVEVYSLQTQTHVATLYKSMSARGDPPVMGHLALPPKPVGELSLAAAGHFLTITSGSSGEAFVFASISAGRESGLDFRCIAKYWTALQTPSEASRPASASEGISTQDTEKPARTPLLSLSDRWLAIVPPYTPSGVSIQGTPLVLEGQVQPYGLSAHSAPAQPLLTCDVAGVDKEGTLSWISRKAAQGVVRVSRQGYELGVQGWKELTHPSPPSQGKLTQEQGVFPPTNAPADDPKRLAREPALVSIIDLQQLLCAEEQKLKQQPHPLATFALEEGCNYLSFSPDGARLLTSNRNGEVSCIWDLGHVAHGAIRPGSDDEAGVSPGPHVKLIHRIPRSSPSTIADSAWSRDGDWLAILTSHRTVHLHEAPFTAAPKKRRRRLTTSTPTPDKSEPTVSLSHGTSPPSAGLLSGWRTWSQSMTTQVNAVTSQYAIPTTFAGFKGAAAAARSAGQRAVAKGLREGYSAAKSGASDMWHAEDNKIRLKLVPDISPKGGWLRWVQRQSGTHLAVACGGTVHLRPVQRVMRQKGEEMVPGLKKEKSAGTFPLPRLSTSRDVAKGKDCAGLGPHGFWGLHASPEARNSSRRRSLATERSSANNEVETNPPYCPFHVDQRVHIFGFEDGGEYNSQAGLQAQIETAQDAMFLFRTRGHGYAEAEEAWVFGERLPGSTKLNEGSGRDPLAVRRGGLLDEEEDLGSVGGLVESRLTVHSTMGQEADGAGQEIRVRSRRARREEGDEVDLLEEDEGDEVLS